MNSAWGNSPVAQILSPSSNGSSDSSDSGSGYGSGSVSGSSSTSSTSSTKAGERTSTAGVYSSGLFLLSGSFLFSFELATGTAARETPGHFNGFGAEVDFWVVFVEPGESEDHALFSEAGYC
jgi:hypothetical protein